MPPDVDYDWLVQDTIGVRSMEDAVRNVCLVSGGGMSGNIRVNYQGMALHVDVKDIPGWFEKRGYRVEFEQDISKGLPCGKVYGYCEPVSTLDKRIEDAVERSATPNGKEGQVVELDK